MTYHIIYKYSLNFFVYLVLFFRKNKPSFEKWFGWVWHTVENQSDPSPLGHVFRCFCTKPYIQIQLGFLVENTFFFFFVIWCLHLKCSNSQFKYSNCDSTNPSCNNNNNTNNLTWVWVLSNVRMWNVFAFQKVKRFYMCL